MKNLLIALALTVTANASWALRTQTIKGDSAKELFQFLRQEMGISPVDESETWSGFVTLKGMSCSFSPSDKPTGKVYSFSYSCSFEDVKNAADLDWLRKTLGGSGLNPENEIFSLTLE